jgi:hypothetical protein
MPRVIRPAVLGLGALVGSLVAACMFIGLASASAVHPKPLRVACSNVIGNETTHQASHGSRLLLDSLFVPTGSSQEAIPLPLHHRWRYWMKAGVNVRAGTGPPVEISLPESWTGRARLTWGNGLPLSTTVEFARCGPRSAGWNGYAGGFYISSPSACVPLRIRVGRATASTTVAIGRRCDVAERSSL